MPLVISYIITVFLLRTQEMNPPHSSYSIRQAIPNCYEFGDVRKGNN